MESRDQARIDYEREQAARDARRNMRVHLFLALLVGMLLGAIAAACISEAHADTGSEVYRIRIALESIAESAKRCAK